MRELYADIDKIQVTLDYLKAWQNAGKKIGVYCAGQHGIEWCKILLHLGFTVSCFVDNDPEKCGNEILKGVPCHSPVQYCYAEDIFFFVCVRNVHYVSVLKRIRTQHLKIAAINDLVDDLILHHRALFFDVMSFHACQQQTELFYRLDAERSDGAEVSHCYRSDSRIAVYTSIFGDYDRYRPPNIYPDGIDYYLVSDHRPDLPKKVSWIDAHKFMPDWITSPIKRNRYTKMHPHVLFKDYRYSVYVDGNVEICGDVSELIPTGQAGISVFRHPVHDCIYYEALNHTNSGRVDLSETITQMGRYLEEGMPPHFGLAEMAIIGRDHSNSLGNRLMDDWWEEFNNGAQRDQFSFSYVLWKNKLNINSLSFLGKDRNCCPLVTNHLHPNNSRNVKNT